MNLNIRIATLLFVIIIFSGSQHSFAQSLSRITSGLDVGTGFKDHEWSPSLLYYQNLSGNKARWLQIGWGIRASGYYKDNTTTLVAPSNAPGNDSLVSPRVSATGVSFLLGINLKFKYFDLGANADLMSIAFGSKSPALYRIADPSMASDSIAPLHNKLLDAGPRRLNALPWVWKQNNGMGEAYVRIWLHQRFGIKLGYMIGRAAYRAPKALNNGQKNFGTAFGMPFASISMPIYN